MIPPFLVSLEDLRGHMPFAFYDWFKQYTFPTYETELNRAFFDAMPSDSERAQWADALRYALAGSGTSGGSFARYVYSLAWESNIPIVDVALYVAGLTPDAE